MSDELIFPHKCNVPGCDMPCATLVIEGDSVRFEWRSTHRHRTHPNSIDAVTLVRLLAVRKPELLRSILERAA
jgi:hypothetical protein